MPNLHPIFISFMASIGNLVCWLAVRKTHIPDCDKCGDRIRKYSMRRFVTETGSVKVYCSNYCSTESMKKGLKEIGIWDIH